MYRILKSKNTLYLSLNLKPGSLNPHTRNIHTSHIFLVISIPPVKKKKKEKERE